MKTIITLYPSTRSTGPYGPITVDLDRWPIGIYREYDRD